MTIGDRIKHLCKQKGITQKQLAELAGLTEPSISRIVNGSREPRANSVLKLADALCVTTDYLLKGKEEEKREWERKLP